MKFLISFKAWIVQSALFIFVISLGLLINQIFDMQRRTFIFGLFWLLFWGTMYVIIKFIPFDERAEHDKLD